MNGEKRVWIINHYAGSMLWDQGGRHYAFAKYLRREGYEPVVFCCNAKHNSDNAVFYDLHGLWREEYAEEMSTPFIFVAGRPYTGNGKQRILNMIDFYRNVKRAAVEYASEHGKPDVIYASSVHPLTLVAGIKLAKRFGVKCICEVRDLWPESIAVYFRKGPILSLMLRVMYRGEHWIYRKADALIFTMEGAYDYIVERGWKNDIPRSKVFFINNGVDLEQFDSNLKSNQIDDEDLRNPAFIKVIYTGSIRKVNNLGVLIDVAKHVKNPKIRFLVWGDGNELEHMKGRVQNEHVENLVFKGRVEKKYIPYITTKADLNLVHNTESSIMRFGLSMNKIFDYFAAGRPILIDFIAPYNPVIDNCAGIQPNSSLVQDIAAAVDLFATMEEEEQDRLAHAARNAARAYDFSTLTQKLIEVIKTIQ